MVGASMHLMPWPYRRQRTAALSIALQGGGAHGAFTWGVLDALLERGLAFAAASGASAGAMNAVVLAHGWMHGGADGARNALQDFWRAIADRVPPLWHTAGDPPQLAAAGHALLAWSRWLAPSQLNPLNLNPLRDVLAAQIDFERLQSTRGMALFIAATEAARGRLRLVRRAEITLDAVLASACLPSLAHPVLIDGQPHWDGAFSANPALWPLVREVSANDLMLVTLSPLGATASPQSAEDIAERVREIAFTAPFLREARWLAELHADALQQPWPRFGIDRRLARLRWHLIDADDTLAELPSNTRLVPDWAFLQRLRDAGRERVASWFEDAGSAIGQRSSIDPLRVFGECAQAPSSKENSVIGLVSV
jgi:NTE family protein